MNFKKVISLLVVLSLLLLAACGTATGKKEELTVADILQKSVEAIGNVESYSTKVDMVMDMMDTKTDLSIEGNVTHNPDAMHLNMNMGLPGMSMDTEIYGVDTEFYMSMFGEWIKMSAEEMGMEDFEHMTMEEMSLFIEFAEDIQLTEEENAYVLTLSAAGEEYRKLTENVLKTSLGDYAVSDEELEEMLANITLNKIDYVLHIDKETFIQTYGKFSFDMELVEEGFTMEMIIDGELEIFNINNVEPIVIPEDVKQNAVDEEELFSDFEDFEFDEEFDFGELELEEEFVEETENN